MQNKPDPTQKIDDAPPQLNDVTRAAVILGVSRRFMVQLIQERKIAHTRVGKKIFVTNQALSAFVEQNTVSAI